MAELLNHTAEQTREAEPRMYAAVSARIMKDVQTANEVLVGRLKKLLVWTAAAVALLLAAAVQRDFAA